MCSATLIRKKMFKWNVFYFSLCPLPLDPSLGTTEKSVSVFFIASHQVFMCIDMTPRSFLFSMLNSPSSLRTYLHQFLTHFCAASLKYVQVSLVVEARHWTQNFRCTSPDLIREEGSPSLTWWRWSFWCSPTIWSINQSSQFCVFCKLAEVLLCLIVQIINEDVKQCWPWYRSLGYRASYWPPAGLHAADCNSLSPVVQPVFSVLHCSFI